MMDDLLLKILEINMKIDMKLCEYSYCPICYEDCSDKKIVIVYNCCCILCKKCFVSWIRHHFTREFRRCPMCRSIIKFPSDTRKILQVDDNDYYILYYDDEKKFDVVDDLNIDMLFIK